METIIGLYKLHLDQASRRHHREGTPPQGDLRHATLGDVTFRALGQPEPAGQHRLSPVCLNCTQTVTTHHLCMSVFAFVGQAEDDGLAS
jgi:hypothetical protein